MTKKEWLIASVITFITLCAWVVFDIIHHTTQVEIPSEVQQVIEPLDPNLNTSLLEETP